MLFRSELIPVKMSSSLDVEALLEEPFKAATPSKHPDRPSSSGATDGGVRNGKDGRDRSDKHREDRDRDGRDDGRSTPRSHDSRRRSRDSERYVISRLDHLCYHLLRLSNVDAGGESMMVMVMTKDVAATQQTGTETAMIGIIVAAIMMIVMTGIMTGEGGDQDPPVGEGGDLDPGLLRRSTEATT